MEEVSIIGALHVFTVLRNEGTVIATHLHIGHGGHILPTRTHCVPVNPCTQKTVQLTTNCMHTSYRSSVYRPGLLTTCSTQTMMDWGRHRSHFSCSLDTLRDPQVQSNRMLQQQRVWYLQPACTPFILKLTLRRIICCHSFYHLHTMGKPVGSRRT